MNELIPGSTCAAQDCESERVKGCSYCVDHKRQKAVESWRRHHPPKRKANFERIPVVFGICIDGHTTVPHQRPRWITSEKETP
jgi:hypothetical protein